VQRRTTAGEIAPDNVGQRETEWTGWRILLGVGMAEGRQRDIVKKNTGKQYGTTRDCDETGCRA